MANKCNQCGKFVAVTEGVKCEKCSCIFHQHCLPASSRSKVRIICHQCLKQKETECDDLFLDAGENSTIHALTEAIKVLREELVAVTKEMTSFRQELKRLNEHIIESNKRVACLEDRMDILEGKFAAERSGVEPNTLVAIAELKAELNEREQDSLINDIEIAGLPEDRGENVMQIVTLTAQKLGMNLACEDIIYAERQGPRRAYPEELPRPRIICVRLARRALRDQFLRVARVRRGADTDGIVNGVPTKFYVNERLSRTNRRIFYKAREEGRRQGWRYIWTREGRVYARRDHGSPAHRIRTDENISVVFGMASVGMT